MTQTSLFEKEKVKQKPKFPSEKGFFMLDRVKVNYNYKADKYPLHIEFTSDEDKKPNLISETGYKSWFITFILDDYNSIQDLIKEYIEDLLDGDNNYTLEFEGVTNKYLREQKECAIGEVEVGEVEESDSAWNEINKMTKRCEKKEGEEEYSYLFVDYIAKPTLESKNEYLSMTSTHKMPNGKLGSSWGSWTWTFEKEETIDKLFVELVDFMKNCVKKPFHPTLKGIATTTLNQENVVISFSKNAKKYMTGLGFDFKKYEIELKKIKQAKATEEDIKKSQRFEIMEKQADRIKDECWAIAGYFSNHNFLPTRNYRNDVDYYDKKVKALGLDTNDLNKLRDLYIKKVRVYRVLYKKIYFERWGKNTNDEYSYP